MVEEKMPKQVRHDRRDSQNEIEQISW